MWPKTFLLYLFLQIAFLCLCLFLWQQPLATTVQAAENEVSQLRKQQTTEGRNQVRGQDSGQATLQVLIPFYNYPTWYDASAYIWDDLAASNANVAITAIINPNDGPDGGPPNEDYTVGLNALRNANIAMVGYVRTNYGARPLAQVKADIDLYNAHYNISGIFLDEASNQSSDLAYYAELYKYIKDRPNLDTVILNPGTNTAEAYLSQPASDVVMLLDDTASAWSAFTPDAYMANYPAERFAVAVYNVPSVAALQFAIDLARTRHIGYVYFTDDTMPNPWDTLPTFWQAELDYIRESNNTPTPTSTPTSTPLSACLVFTGSLDGSQEVPPVVTTMQGEFTITHDSTSNQTNFSLNVIPSTTTGTVTGIHIHIAQQGANGPVIRNLATLAGLTLPVTITNTLTIAGLIAPAFSTEEIKQLLNRELYINVHTTSNPAGEIRGQIVNKADNCSTPTPTTPASVTPTSTPTSTPASTRTPPSTLIPATPLPSTPTPTMLTTPTPTTSTYLYLPAIAQMPTKIPTQVPTATPTVEQFWQQIAGDNLTVAQVALRGETLFIGTRGNDNDSTRGLYSGNIAACRTGVTLGRVRAVPTGSVLGVAFQGINGVTASFDHGIYYTNDGGSVWSSGTPAVIQPRTVAIVADTFFVGTESKGVYLSSDGGRTWEQRRNEPASINVVKLDGKVPELLWIGTDTEGVYSLRIGDTDTFAQNTEGLNGNALKVWDFAFETTQIYLATEGGIFVGDGTGPWAPFGPSPVGVQFYSLELVGITLYAGANVNGVWRKPLSGGSWERISTPGWSETATVRNLLYDPTHCNGLLAATDDGVWLYR